MIQNLLFWFLCFDHFWVLIFFDEMALILLDRIWKSFKFSNQYNKQQNDFAKCCFFLLFSLGCHKHELIKPEDTCYAIKFHHQFFWPWQYNIAKITSWVFQHSVSTTSVNMSTAATFFFSMAIRENIMTGTYKGFKFYVGNFRLLNGNNKIRSGRI